MPLDEIQVAIGDSFQALRVSRPPDVVMVEGPRGTAKTRSILSCLLADMLEQPGMKVGLCRSTRTRLTDQVLDTLETQVFPAFGMPVPGGASQKNRSDYTLFNGSKFLLRGLDDLDRSKSFEATKIYVSELSELDDPNDFIGLLASLRQPGYSGKCLVGDVNPVFPSFWANKMSEPAGDELRNLNINTRDDYRRALRFNLASPKGEWKRIVTSHKDNPGYWDHAVWDWTEAGLEYKKKLTKYTGFMLARWWSGLWAASEGTVFGAEFSLTRNVRKPFAVPSHWPTVYYNDPGYDHPNAGIWVAISPTNTRFVVSELYERQTSIPDDPDTGKLGIASLIKDRERFNGFRPHRRFLDPGNGFSRTQFSQDGTTIAEQFEKEGLYFDPWRRLSGSSKDAGVNDVRRALMNGKLVVFDTCVNTIQEFQSWSYKRNTKGEQLAGDDQYEDRNNHAMDCIIGMEVNGHTYAEGNPAPPEPESIFDDEPTESE